MSFLDKTSLLCNKVSEKCLVLLGITMACTVILQVIYRYVFNNALFWSEELARYLLVWLTFLGATTAYYRKMHPGVEIFYNRLPQNLQGLCRKITELLSACFFCVMIIYGFWFSYFIRSQISPALSLPKWIIFLIIPLSGIIMLIHCAARVKQEFTKGDR